MADYKELFLLLYNKTESMARELRELHEKVGEMYFEIRDDGDIQAEEQ